MSQFSPAVAATLAQFFAAEAKRHPLEPGTHSVQATISLVLDGVVSRAGAEQYTPTTSVPLKSVLALLIPFLGDNREQALDIIAKAMAYAITADVKADDVLALSIKDITQTQNRVTQTLGEMPPKERAGKTSHKVAVTAG
jgi:hypothetical protein